MPRHLRRQARCGTLPLVEGMHGSVLTENPALLTPMEIPLLVLGMTVAAVVARALLKRYFAEAFPEFYWFPTDRQRHDARNGLTKLRFSRWYLSLPLVVLGAILPALVVVRWLRLPSWALVLILSCWFPLLMVGQFWLSRRHIRTYVRQKLIEAGVPVCRQCGYDLRGQVEPRCPECGQAFHTV